MDYKWYFMYNEVKWTFQTKGGKKEKQTGTFGIRVKMKGCKNYGTTYRKSLHKVREDTAGR